MVWAFFVPSRNWEARATAIGSTRQKSVRIP